MISHDLCSMARAKANVVFGKIASQRNSHNIIGFVAWFII